MIRMYRYRRAPRMPAQPLPTAARPARMPSEENENSSSRMLPDRAVIDISVAIARNVRGNRGQNMAGSDHRESRTMTPSRSGVFLSAVSSRDLHARRPDNN